MKSSFNFNLCVHIVPHGIVKRNKKLYDEDANMALFKRVKIKSPFFLNFSKQIFKV